MTFQLWLFWVAGVVLGGIATFVFAWAIFADQISGNRGKRRCSRCWYDMTSVGGRKCPECGREANEEAKLFRTRRRWGWASVGVLALFCAFALNWYAAGRLLGWTRVMPLWLQLRLVWVIGQQDVISGIGGGGIPTLSLDSGSAAILQSIVLDELGKPKAGPSGRQSATRALLAIKDQITDRERVGKFLLEVARQEPNSLYHTAGKMAREMLGQERFAEEVSAVVRAIPNKPGTRNDFGIFALMDTQAPFGPAAINMAVDLIVLDSQPGTTYPMVVAMQSEQPALFFGRLLEHFRAGDAKKRQSIYWILRGNVRSTWQIDPSYLAMAREACSMLASDDEESRNGASAMVNSMFPDVVAPVFPEIAALLSADLEWTRRQARSTLANVRASKEQEAELVAALCEALRNGRDRGRALAVEILGIRRQSLRPGVDVALLDAIERTEDADLGDRLVQQFSWIACARNLFPATFGPRSNADWERLESRLIPMLDRGGAHTAVACKWIARLPLPREAAMVKLQSMATDGSRAAPDRAAARDALLHIRDLSRPEVDVLEPLK